MNVPSCPSAILDLFHLNTQDGKTPCLHASIEKFGANFVKSSVLFIYPITTFHDNMQESSF